MVNICYNAPIGPGIDRIPVMLKGRGVMPEGRGKTPEAFYRMQ